MARLKSGTPFIYADETDDIIGIRDIDGGEQLFLNLTDTGLTKGGLALTSGQAAVMRAGIDVTKLSKLRASMSAARNNNPQVLAPWSAAPTWEVGTLYGAGQIVRGTGADAENLYLMAGTGAATNAAGTSAASGSGPTGQAPATLVTDNTCRWVYVGPATTPAGAVPMMNTATLSAPGDAMNGLLHIMPHGSFAALGLSGFRPSTAGTYASEAFCSGGIYEGRQPGRVNGGNGGTVASPSYPASKERGSIKFCTNSRKWIGLRGEATININVSYEIIVNGRYISESPFVSNATVSNSFLLNLASFPEGVKEIEIRVYNGLRASVAFETYTEAGATMWPTENANRIKLSVEGDSIAMGSYISGARPRYWLERIVGDHLGIDDVYNQAEGGTGAISASVGTKTTYLQRLPDIVEFGPDVLVINGFHNDNGDGIKDGLLFNSDTRRAAFLAYFQACRDQMPKCTIFVVGAQLLQGETASAGATTQYQVELDAKAAFDTFADANSIFIPILTGARARLNSANGPHYMVTTAPYADTHPTPQYYPFMGGYIASKIAAWVASQ